MSETIVGKAAAGFYPKEEPGIEQALKSGMEQEMRGELILTDRRLVFINYSGRKYLPVDSDRIKEGLTNEGSFETPLNMIIEAKADRAWGTPYLSLRYRTQTGEQACSFFLICPMIMRGTKTLYDQFREEWRNIRLLISRAGLSKIPCEEIAKAIEQLKAEYASPT